MLGTSRRHHGRGGGLARFHYLVVVLLHAGDEGQEGQEAEGETMLGGHGFSSKSTGRSGSISRLIVTNTSTDLEFDAAGGEDAHRWLYSVTSREFTVFLRQRNPVERHGHPILEGRRDVAVRGDGLVDEPRGQREFLQPRPFHQDDMHRCGHGHAGPTGPGSLVLHLDP